MRRREKSVLTATVLSVGFVAQQYVPLEWRPLALIALAIFTYILTAWTLYENLDSVEWLTVVPFPALYTVAVAAFYFLLPASLIAQVGITLFFGLGMYALLLAGNIFSIAKVRTIQLLRAAQAVEFLFCLIAALLAFNTLFSLSLWFVLNGVIAGVIAGALSLPFFWCIRLEKRLSREVLALTARTMLVVGGLAAVLSFFPGNLWPTSLFLMTVLYSALGLGQSGLEQRLFTNTVREYLGVVVAVFATYCLLLPWK